MKNTMMMALAACAAIAEAAGPIDTVEMTHRTRARGLRHPLRERRGTGHQLHGQALRLPQARGEAARLRAFREMTQFGFDLLLCSRLSWFYWTMFAMV